MPCSNCIHCLTAVSDRVPGFASWKDVILTMVSRCMVQLLAGYSQFAHVANALLGREHCLPRHAGLGLLEVCFEALEQRDGYALGLALVGHHGLLEILVHGRRWRYEWSREGMNTAQGPWLNSIESGNIQTVWAKTGLQAGGCVGGSARRVVCRGEG
jgi:hypothetical protein